MRAHNITTMTQRRRNTRRRLALALALGLCALAIPESVSAEPQPVANYSSLNAITGGSDDSSSGQSSAGSQSASAQPPHGAGYSSVNAITPPTSEPTLVYGSAADDADGFDWASAAVGAGAAMALVALGGAWLLTVRRRAAMTTSAPTG
jgi:hypothetical protein